MSCAAINANVFSLDIHYEKDIILRHDMHPAFTGGRKVGASIFLPGDLGGRVANSGTLQPSRRPGADTQVHRRLREGREHWKKTKIHSD